MQRVHVTVRTSVCPTVDDTTPQPASNSDPDTGCPAQNAMEALEIPVWPVLVRDASVQLLHELGDLGDLGDLGEDSEIGSVALPLERERAIRHGPAPVNAWTPVSVDAFVAAPFQGSRG